MSKRSLIFFLLLTITFKSHALEPEESTSIKLDSSILWAINVGGKQYLGADGIHYESDLGEGAELISSLIQGTQDKTIFKSYRLGKNSINKTIENGTYDLIFNFAEPDDIEAGARVFNVKAEGSVLIENLDIVATLGKASLTRMLQNVEVTDGVLNVELEPVIGEPVLNALVVRQKMPKSDDWVMVWNDEFEGSGKPDPEKWNYNIWPAKKVNDEDQTYTDRLKNVRVEEGLLIIEAHKEQYNNAEYSSGRINSADKGDILYGRVEVRAKLPYGQGTWPAIWMMPNDIEKYATPCPAESGRPEGAKCDGWPNSGEIDIMEHVGYDMNRIHGTVHNKAYYWVNGEQRRASIEAHDVDKEFHVYALEWSPERLDVFYDGSLYFTYLNQGEGWTGWPYDHPFHVILNVAVGGGWGGAGGPTDDSAFPVQMQVDYVRLYQKEKP